MFYDIDKFHEECGVFGIWGHKEAANLTYLGLYALQHRGQESAGIVSSDGKHLYIEKDMGLVADIFSQERLSRLPGHAAIGHVRYSTTGSSSLKNAQPIAVDCVRGSVALAHNGNLVNAQRLRARLEEEGSIFQSTTDTEVIVHLLALSRKADFLDALIEALSLVEGAYSLVIATEKDLIGVRDPRGFRPLCLGRLGSTYVLASESCALDLIEAKYEREIEPGEMVVINQDGLTSYKPFTYELPTPCIFEYIYFSRPDSIIYGGQSVYEIREELGRQLARETGVEADLIVPVPDSGVCAALGYSQITGIPFGFGLIRNHYVGRTFIEPQQSIRHFGVKIKLNPVRSLLQGKRVIVIDDSIVRGTTSRKIVTMIFSAGAKEVHMRISAPPTLLPCYYGIDTPTRRELIASSHKVDEICRYLRATSLGYLSVEGLFKAVGGKDFCAACFTGQYPVPFPWEEMVQLGLFEKS